MSKLQIAVEQIEMARGYTQAVLAKTPDELWFSMPGDGVTHIAWQVGHLAVTEYALALERIRGRRDADAQLMDDAFRAAFGKASVPSPAVDPLPAELRDRLDRIHAQVLTELAELTDADVDVPLEKPHRLFRTKLGGLMFCSQHEMLHVGQIGLLRRQLGSEPMW